MEPSDLWSSIKRGSHKPHPESFAADEDINLNDKHFNDQTDMDFDNEPVQISNISHVELSHDDECPTHPTRKHKWEDSHNPANWPVKQGKLTFTYMMHQTDANKDNDSLLASDDQREVLIWHHYRGHLSCSMLKCLAKHGEILKHLANVNKPKCVCCLFGKRQRPPGKLG